jgi:tRNA nucleotidyltransferase/poly(A) polymerase
LAALLHDISKPATRRWAPDKSEWTFYGHEVVGERTTKKILKELKFPKEMIDRVSKLVRWHMFFSDTEQITHSAVRRIISKVGQENIWDLMNIRICDRVGTGRPKENPYRLRKYKAMIEEVMRDPVSVGMLKIDGARIMEIAKINPGPKIGYILHALLEEALEDPTINTPEILEKKALTLLELPEKELKTLGEKGKEKKDEEEGKHRKDIQKKYHVN